MINYIDKLSDEKLKEFIDKLVPSSNTIYFDTETEGLDPRLNKILLAQFMIDDEIYVLNIPKLGLELLTRIAERAKESNIKIVAHNAKFDWKFIYHYTGVEWNNVYDTMNAECILNAGIGSSTYSLEDLVLTYLGEEIDKSVRESFFSGNTSIDFTEQQILYSAKDVKVLKPIHTTQIKKATDTKELRVLEVEMGIIPVVAKMEYDGVLLDQEEWLKLEKKALRKAERYKPIFKGMLLGKVDLSKYKNALEVREAFAFPKSITKKKTAVLESITDTNAIRGWLCNNFNIGSSQQVKQAFINIGINVPNTNAKVLEADFGSYREVQALLKIREQEKRANSFGSNIFEKIHPVTGRIHAEYLNNGAATGRMSYSYHNIPRLKEYRNAFSIAREGWSIISADYSQAEYRLTGAISGEDAIIQAYLEGKDMHSATAAIRFKKNINDITKAERNIAKSINFLMIYGGTAWGMQWKLNVPLNEAEEIVNEFWRGYPKLAKFKEIAEKKIIERGYSVTPLGRRRYMSERPAFMDINQYASWVRRQKRELFNHIIQGGSADSVKIAMLNCYNENPFGDKFRLLQQEHDELVAEVHNSIAKDAEQFVIETMEKSFQPFLGEIPAKVDSNLLPYWTK